MQSLRDASERKVRDGGISAPCEATRRNRQRVFYTTSDYRYYLKLVQENLKDAGIAVLEYCRMANHVHFVVKVA
jgi:hypothetical protein